MLDQVQASGSERINADGPKTQASEDPGNPLPVLDYSRTTIRISREDRQNLGVLNTIRANRIQSKRQIEAQEVIFGSQISCLQHEAAAKERQVKAYCDTRSVDVAEGLRTYAQANMQLLEQARQNNKSQAVEAVYIDANTKIEAIIDKDIPDSLKQEMATRIIEIRDQTIDRIMGDTLAKAYDLGPAS